MQTSRQRVSVPRADSPRPPHGAGALPVLARTLAIGLTSAAAVLAASTDQARAAFPGQNGLIAFSNGDLSTIKSDGSGRQTITPGGVTERNPSTSPDGKRLVFESFGQQGPDTDIFVANADGTESKDLTANALSGDGYALNDYQPTWSPDGTRIAFISTRAPAAAQTGADIWVMNADGSGAKQLTSLPASEQWPAWSPDGHKIAFSYAAPRGGTEDVYTVNADGTGLTNLTNDPNGNERQPSWSPDGTLIAYASVSSIDINGEVFVMRADGTDRRRLTEHPGVDDDPAFSPDGRKIAFHTTRAGSQDIFIMNANGSQPVTLTPTPGEQEAGPDWGPAPDRDGDGIADDPDNCDTVPNADQRDMDGDALGDLCDPDRDGDALDDQVDNCPDLVNPTQADGDGDGLGDMCDEDRDGDTIANHADNCADTANAGQADADGDGLGDVCDTDRDGDEVPDDSDNCPVASNVDQANADGDGMGDVCDSDADGDGIVDVVDNCRGVPNPGQGDADRDGRGDACDEDRSAAQQIADLIDAVRALSLHHGIERSLTAKLRAALDALNAGHNETAHRQVLSFELEVRAQSGKWIDDADADWLLERAAAIPLP